MKALALSLVLVVFSACAVDPSGASVQFQRHALACERPGVGARLELLDQEPCALELREDGLLFGTCAGVKSGEAIQVRLVYFADNGGDTLELAYAVKLVDLRDPDSSEVSVEFESELLAYPDDDQDGASNLSEWCAGTNPRD